MWQGSSDERCSLTAVLLLQITIERSECPLTAVLLLAIHNICSTNESYMHIMLLEQHLVVMQSLISSKCDLWVLIVMI